MSDIKNYVIVTLVALLVLLIVVGSRAAVTLEEDSTALKSYIDAGDDGWVICSRDCAFMHYTSHLKWEGCFALCKDAIKDTGSPVIYDDDSYTKKAKPVEGPPTTITTTK